MDRRRAVTGRHHGGVEIELAVQLQGARMHHHGARSRARPAGLVDDAHRNPLPGEPERKHQPGGAGADDENVVWRFHAL
ncbi:hypothetical protein D3C78_1498060 [compost metagenome]